jgi:hypothetical protein
MKSRSEIWLSLLDEIGRDCSVSTSLDHKMVERRRREEGESFFTISLPLFHRDLLRSLEEQRIPSDAFPGYSRRMLTDNHGIKHRGTPKFLGEFLDLLFTSESRVLLGEERLQDFILEVPVLRPIHQLDDRAMRALRGLRQLLLLFSKEKSLCDQSKIDQAISSYAKIDEQVTDPLRIAAGVSFSKEVSPRLPEGSSVSFMGQLLALLTVWFTMVSWFLGTGRGLLPIIGMVISSGLCLIGILDLSTYSLIGKMPFQTLVSRARKRT